jgi:hypothetical protein
VASSCVQRVFTSGTFTGEICTFDQFWHHQSPVFLGLDGLAGRGCYAMKHEIILPEAIAVGIEYPLVDLQAIMGFNSAFFYVTYNRNFYTAELNQIGSADRQSRRRA